MVQKEQAQVVGPFGAAIHIDIAPETLDFQLRVGFKTQLYEVAAHDVLRAADDAVVVIFQTNHRIGTTRTVLHQEIAGEVELEMVALVEGRIYFRLKVEAIVRWYRNEQSIVAQRPDIGGIAAKRQLGKLVDLAFRST